MIRRRKEEPRENASRSARTNASRDPFYDVEQVASATECTGLLPAQIQSPEEGRDVSSLESIHTIHPRFVDGNDED